MYISQNSDPFLTLNLNQIQELNLPAGTELKIYAYLLSEIEEEEKDTDQKMNMYLGKKLEIEEFRVVVTDGSFSPESDVSFSELHELAKDGNRIAFSLPSQPSRYFWQKQPWKWVDGILKIQGSYPSLGN